MSENVSIVSEEQCTGCAACFNKCPVNAIELKYNSEGFLFPAVNDRCTNCGLCKNICPALKKPNLHEDCETYAVCASDEIRLISSSGGMFSLLSKAIFDMKGVVFGARYSEDYLYVYHTVAHNYNELDGLRSSKYVQSEVRLTYKEAEKYLKQDIPVLYTGCPCQISGLYAYLGKDYKNLFTVDLICHGANSVKAYQSFVKEYSNGKKIKKIDFRDKKYYEWSTPTVMYFEDGTVRKSPWNEGKWYEGFLNGIINRKCCYNCEYAKSQRVSDITLGDAWQIHRIDKNLDDRKGTSLVLINTKKGKEIFEICTKNAKIKKEIPLSEIRKYNGQINGPTKKHKNRNIFFSNLDSKGYHLSLDYSNDRKFDVGIVGWWFASNYGSSLTYYALGKILNRMGKQVLFIPIPKIDGTPWERETSFTVEFISKHFKIGRKRDFSHMKEFNDLCDSFMVGSDQMWTYASTKQVWYTFFLDFVNNDKRKIAYATSFGKSSFDADKETILTIKDYLNRFDGITVRESTGVDICKNKFGISVEQVIDPIFSCSVSDFDSIVEKPNYRMPDRYLLCYILDPNEEKERIVQKVSNYYNLSIVTILGLKEYNYAQNKWKIGEVLPQLTTPQFIYCIKNSEYVITDSHHGVCMSIIYHKNYLGIVNNERGRTRFDTVACSLGLQHRLVENIDDLENNDIFNDIDYVTVDKMLNIEVNRSSEWLKTVLEKPVKECNDTIRTVDAKHRAIEFDLLNRITYLEKNIKNIEDKFEKCNSCVNKNKEGIIYRGFRYLKKHGILETIKKILNKLC